MQKLGSQALRQILTAIHWILQATGSITMAGVRNSTPRTFYALNPRRQVKDLVGLSVQLGAVVPADIDHITKGQLPGTDIQTSSSVSGDSASSLSKTNLHHVPER